MHLFIIMLIHQESRSFTFGGFLYQNLREKDTSTWNHTAPAQTSFHVVWPFLTTKNSVLVPQYFLFNHILPLFEGGPAENFDQNSVIEKYQGKSASFAIFFTSTTNVKRDL